MLYKYKVTDLEGKVSEGEIDAVGLEAALRSLQKRNLIVISLDPVKSKMSFFEKDIFSFERVKKRDIVVFFRQISTLFEAKVPALVAFELLVAETENPLLQRSLADVSSDIRGGLKISDAMAKHPKIFDNFHIQMIKSGEETGELEDVFKFLADYLERSYELTSKATRALIYPAFVIVTFVVVVVLMMTMVIPQLAGIIKESGQEPPIYTKVVLALSDFLLSYGAFFSILLIALVIVFWRYSLTNAGKIFISKTQLKIPYIGDLYKKIYISRVADNLATLFSGGVATLRSLEITKDVVGNYVYKSILSRAFESVKGGAKVSESFSRHEEIPQFVNQMIKIGEETGKMNFILKTVATFYRKEVDQSLETLVSLLEPLMTIVLGVVVGLLLASVLIPIYSIALSA